MSFWFYYLLRLNLPNRSLLTQITDEEYMLERMDQTFSENPEARHYGYWMLAKTAEAGTVFPLPRKLSFLFCSVLKPYGMF